MTRTGMGKLSIFLEGGDGGLSDPASPLAAVCVAGAVGDLPLSLFPKSVFPAHRLTKLAVNSVLNPLAALSGSLNGALGKALGPGGGLEEVGRGLSSEAVRALVQCVG